MAQQEYPTLNAIAPSWADVQTSFQLYDGPLVETADYSAISWSSSLEIGEQRGASGGRVLKRTTGQQSLEASATFYKSGLRTLLKALAAQAPKRGTVARVGLVVFDIFVQFTPPGEVEIYETKIKGCRLTGLSNSIAEGTDASPVEVSLNPMEIVELIDGQQIALL